MRKLFKNILLYVASILREKKTSPLQDGLALCSLINEKHTKKKQCCKLKQSLQIQNALEDDLQQAANKSNNSSLPPFVYLNNDNNYMYHKMNIKFKYRFSHWILFLTAMLVVFIDF